VSERRGGTCGQRALRSNSWVIPQYEKGMKGIRQRRQVKIEVEKKKKKQRGKKRKTDEDLGIRLSTGVFCVSSWCREMAIRERVVTRGEFKNLEETGAAERKSRKVRKTEGEIQSV